jgi:hypothetical protein
VLSEQRRHPIGGLFGQPVRGASGGMANAIDLTCLS